MKYPKINIEEGKKNVYEQNTWVNNRHLNNWKYPINLEINLKGGSRFDMQPSYAMFCSKSFAYTPHFNQVRYSYPHSANKKLIGQNRRSLFRIYSTPQ